MTRTARPAVAGRAFLRLTSSASSSLRSLLKLLLVDYLSVPSDAGKRVLFIGNSLTYSNSMPSIVQADFDRASESYALAAADVDGMLFPVAEAWRAAWRRDPSVSLYSTDGLHPTPAGSYLAALVIFGQLYGRSPVGLPARIRLRSGAQLSIAPDVATLLQQAAEEANARFGRR